MQMKMYFFRFWVLLSLGVSIVVSCSQRSSQNLEWIPFTWVSDSVSGKFVDKIAINIPVTIDELPHKFSMQFDLGAVRTCFYGNVLNVYLEKYPALNNKLDTTKKFWIQGEENPMFGNIHLQLGEVAFRGVDVGLFKNYGDVPPLDLKKSETEIHIGTIAPDLFQNKILIIDYKLNRLAVVNSLPSEYQNITFENFKIEKGRIKIPLQINGKVEDVMFDTGSSMFSLITTKQNALEISGSKIVDSLMISSWGKCVPFYGLETVAPILFGDKKLGNSVVYYCEEAGFDNFYKSENIWGITGNAFFFNDVIIIDYKENRFGVK